MMYFGGIFVFFDRLSGGMPNYFTGDIKPFTVHSSHGGDGPSGPSLIYE